MALMFNDDDDDDYVCVGIFGIGDSVELPTGGVLSLSDRGRWICWWRRRPLCSDAVAFVVVVFVVIVSQLLSSGCVCIVALSLAHDGECWWLVATAIVGCRCIVESMSELPGG